VRNQASSLIYSTEKSLKEVGDKLDPAARGEVESALADLKKVSENGTVGEIKPAVDRLQQASYKMAELLYQKTTAGANGASGDGQPAGEGAQTESGAASSEPAEDVIDAEFKEAK
jgi:molecular chaperone DnaK